VAGWSLNTSVKLKGLLSLALGLGYWTLVLGCHPCESGDTGLGLQLVGWVSAP